MNDLFQKRVRAAATATWWTFLAGIAMTFLIGAGSLHILNAKPEWIVHMWRGIPWETIQTSTVWIVGIFKMIIWLVFLLAIWLTIWASKLRKIKE